MNISLVFPPFYVESMYNLVPLGLVNLATSVKDRSYNIKIFDFILALRQGKLKMNKNIYDCCANKILKSDPDIVGFSAQCTTYPSVINIAQKLKKKRKNIKIIIGGHNASFVDTKTLTEFPWIDAIVRGEGEATFKELLDACYKNREWEGIDGITYRKHKKIIRNKDRAFIDNLDDILLPDYSYLPSLQEYKDACSLPRSVAILEVGRGCPHKCVYCSESILWKQKTRTFSIKRLVKEMRYLHEKFNAECFLLSYDQFTANRKFVIDFCNKVIDEKLNHIPWYCISRLDTVDSEVLKLMHNAGCESMCYGIDSGSKKTLAFIRKKIDLKILYSRVIETTENNIVPTLSYIIGFPQEQKEDIDATLTLSLKTGVLGNSNPLIQIPTILPGTELFNLYHNSLIQDVDTYFSLGLEFDDGYRIQSDNKLISDYPEIFSSFYNIPCDGESLFNLNIIANNFPMIVNLYPKSFLLCASAFSDSVSDYFLNFILWLKGKKRYDSFILPAPDCYTQFPEYAQETAGRLEGGKWGHIKDVIEYEKSAILSGKYKDIYKTGNIDLCALEKYPPVCGKNIIIRKFEYDLSVIVDDLKKGIIKQEYDKKKSFFVFLCRGSELEVTQINDFGKDFLQLSNGLLTVNDIALKLFPLYGNDSDFEKFLSSCQDTICQLAELEFINFSCNINS